MIYLITSRSSILRPLHRGLLFFIDGKSYILHCSPSFGMPVIQESDEYFTTNHYISIKEFPEFTATDVISYYNKTKVQEDGITQIVDTSKQYPVYQVRYI